jgi:uncharacterized protein (TIGR03437 family)
VAVFTLAVAAGQTQDTSGNGLLQGQSYRFRHIAVLNVDENLDPTEIAATYGTIAFNAGGNYSVTATTLDNTVAGGAPQPLSVTGTYAIGANGAGYISNPLSPTDFNTYIYGALAQGVYTGSSTESQQEGVVMNDIFIAIPAGSPSNASFTTPYQTGLLDFAGAGPSAIKNALFELSPNGQGKFGTINLSGQAANQSASSLTQSIAGATYNFNGDGSATLTIPLPSNVSLTNALFTGSKTIFESEDGNFILGWTAGGYDIFFGVSALTITGNNSVSGGLYFTAGLEDSPGIGGTESFYGGTSNFGDSAGDGIIHERLNSPLGLSGDFGTDDQIGLNSDGTTSVDFNGNQYIFGDAGTCQNGSSTFPCAAAFVAIGTDGNFELMVGLHAPIFSGTGVYVYPTGVVNAASYQPITASLAPGELITLFGTGLSSSTIITQGGQAFLTTLGGVSVSIDGLACPIYYVSPTQLSVIVPYGVASNQTGLANIQVTNGSVKSNVVQMYLTDSAPGSFSLETTPALVTQSGEPSVDGIGYSAALHAATGALVTPSDPAQPGEYISVFLTGLGTVTPTIMDGALGPSTTLSWSDLYSAQNLGVLFNDYNNGSTENFGTIEFAGLAPGLAGLYQINVQVPEGVLGAGDDVYIEFVTDAADVDQIQIPFGSAFGGLSTGTTARPGVKALKLKASRARASAMRRQGMKPTAHRVRRGAPATDSN